MPKRRLTSASLGGGVLRLMMAAIVFMTVGPMSFLVGFAVSEVIGYLSTIIAKEVTRMGNAVVKCVEERTGETGKSHLPVFRDTLLTSL